MAKEKARKSKDREARKESEFDQRIIDIARVTRVMAGGKRMRFRACLVIGDKKGRAGYGLAKGADVTLAINKAMNIAKKNLVSIPTNENGTIPHAIRCKLGAAKILLKPAPIGTGIIAGGAMRMVLEVAGIKNVVGKILGTNNKVNNVKATFKAIEGFKLSKKKKPVAKEETEQTAEKKVEDQALIVENKEANQ
ncbi:MAG: 30S ribosomal protein S5 [bacterium]